MAACKFCGNWAGLFRDHHKECAERDAAEQDAAAAERAAKQKDIDEKVAKVKALMSSAPEGAVPVEELASLIAPIADGNADIPWRAFCEWSRRLWAGIAVLQALKRS